MAAWHDGAFVSRGLDSHVIAAEDGLRIEQQTRPQRLRHVLVSRPDLVSCAERMAHAWRGSIQVIAPGELRPRVRSLLELPHVTVVVVGLREDLDDDFLLESLVSLERFVVGTASWESVPEIALLVGRDIGNVTRLLDKILNSSSGRCSTARLMHIQASADSAEAVEVERYPGAGMSVRRAVEGGAPLLEVLRRPAHAIAFQTHGGEACARGGGGAVLCGRSARPVPTLSGATGVLACGRDLPCPRGPFPLPLREVQAPLFLLASCNGLRLADGALTEDFNLGLSFLDGEGQAYVSSISGIRGNDLASKVFLAAVSSGASLGEATALVNAALIRTGIDAPRFMAMGSPTFVASPDRSRPAPLRGTPTDSGILEIDAGGEHFIEVLLDENRVCALVEQDALLLTALDPGPEVLWFSRAEVAPENESGSRYWVRLFLFRFPESLGRLRLEVGDRRRATEDALRWTTALARWLELWRIFGLAAREVEAYSELRAAHDDAAAKMSQLLLGLAWSTVGRARVDELCAAIRSLAGVAAGELLPELAARLRATFWLPNEDAASYQLYAVRSHVCSACGRAGNERCVRNPVTGDARHIRSCGRCGITFEGNADGPVRDVRLRTPDLVRCGDRFSLVVEVEIEPRGIGLTLAVHPRLATHMVDQIIPEPAEASVFITSAGVHVLTFAFEVPSSLLPHQHFIKIIATTEQELVFASRLIFVE